MAMNILDLIKQDHEKTLKALDDIRSISTRTTGLRDRPWVLLERDLLRHMHGEEAIFYPSLGGTIRDKILEAVEEHNLVKVLIKQMDDIPTDEEVWTAKLRVMTENIRHHIQEEEGPVFRAARDSFSQEELEDMGIRFEVAKETVRR